MNWVSAVSSDADCEEAVRICCADIASQMGSDSPDVVFLFVAPSHREFYSTIQQWVQGALGCETIVGCTARGIIGRSLEIESGPAISISAAILPGTEIHSCHVDFGNMPDIDASQATWKAWLDLGESEHFVILADPFNVSLEDLLLGLDYVFPNAAKVGGLASAAGKEGENALFRNGRTYNRGAVILGLSGNIVMDTIVAQGCRPVGKVATVTGSDSNVIHTLDDQPALSYLQELQKGLGEYDRSLFKSAVFLGVTTDPFVTQPVEGDYLIRNLIGIDYQTGAIILAGKAEEGALVQVHLRDRKSSRLDLEKLLENYMQRDGATSCLGTLLFSCLGRGQYLYGSTNHDCDMITDKLGPVPIGGFFCAGEIGPVGPETYIHGYTSSIGVFRSRE